MGTGARVDGQGQRPGAAPNVVGGGQLNSAPFGDFRVVTSVPDFFQQPFLDEWQITAENEGTPTSHEVWADCVSNL